MKTIAKLMAMGVAATAFAFVPGSQAAALDAMAAVTPGVSTAVADNFNYVSDAVNFANAGTISGVGPLSGLNIEILDSTGAPTLPLPVLPDLDKGGVGGDNMIDIGTGGYYLIVKYDGDNGGGLIFNVNGMSGDVEVPGVMPGTENTPNHFVLFGADKPNETPDGGATALLLGVGCLGLAAASRKRK